MSVLFATGLLLNQAFLGWMILFGLFLKMFLHEHVERSTVTVFAAV